MNRFQHRPDLVRSPHWWSRFGVRFHCPSLYRHSIHQNTRISWVLLVIYLWPRTYLCLFSLIVIFFLFSSYSFLSLTFTAPRYLSYTYFVFLSSCFTGYNLFTSFLTLLFSHSFSLSFSLPLLLSLSLSLSLRPHLYLSIYLSISISPSLFHSPSTRRPSLFSLTLYLPLYLFLSLPF